MRNTKTYSPPQAELLEIRIEQTILSGEKNASESVFNEDGDILG